TVKAKDKDVHIANVAILGNTANGYQVVCQVPVDAKGKKATLKNFALPSVLGGADWGEYYIYAQMAKPDTSFNPDTFEATPGRYEIEFSVRKK
ncbi:MAG: hypothetical protein NT106_14525, partial [Candidatus Sumerlaeota bacterium]|nr:hypothetical protein [Candidatus Sumerlaeota bacterium]